MNTQKNLECEIKELQLEIKSGKTTISTLQRILEQKEQQLKEMNDTQRNWKVETMNANYPMLEVIDENTVKIEGVEYKKVSKEKPQTLERIITECMIAYNNTVIVELMERILDRVEVEFFPKLGSIEPPLYNDGWEDCLKELKTRLRE